MSNNLNYLRPRCLMVLVTLVLRDGVGKGAVSGVLMVRGVMSG